MNRALTNRFLTLLNNITLQTFQATLQQSPNMIFVQVLEWFVDQFGQSNDTKRQNKPTNIEAD